MHTAEKAARASEKVRPVLPQGMQRTGNIRSFLDKPHLTSTDKLLMLCRLYGRQQINREKSLSRELLIWSLILIKRVKPRC